MLKYLLLLVFLASCSGNPLGDERSTRDRNPPVGATISGWQWNLSSPDNGSLSNDNTPIVELTNAGEEEGGKVTLYSDAACSNQVGTTRTIRSGSTSHANITFDPNGADDGFIEFFTIVEDVSLNSSECSITGLSYTLAAGIPLVSINSPAIISQVNQNSYDLNGQCSEPGLDVIIQIASLGIMNTPCDTDNTWTLSGVNVSSLAEGNVTILADHTDVDLVAAAQASSTTLKDTTAPSLTEVQSFTWSLSSPNDGVISNDITPLISLSGASSEDGANVSMFSDNVCSNSLESGLTINSGSTSFGNINFQNDGTDDGVKNFYVVVTDLAGNASACVDILLTYTLDTVAPSVAVVSAPQVTTANQGSYDLSGTCSEAGLEVSINIAGLTPAPQPTCSGGNIWNVVGMNLSTAPEGNLSLIINHQDQATNTTTLNLIVNKDTTAPTDSEINGFTWVLSSPSNGSVSNDTTPVISLSGADLENSGNVQLFDNATCTSSKGATQVISTGMTEHTDISYLSDNSDDGVIEFFAVVTDTANNISNCVDISLGYTLDTAAPTVSLDAPSNITSSNASSYDLSGTCSEPGVALNVTVGAVSANPQPICDVSNNWSITGMDASGAAEGNIDVIARLSDVAGNNATNASATITKDAIAPTQAEVQALTWTLSSPTGSSFSNDASPILDMSGAGSFNSGSVEVFSDNTCSSSISSTVVISSGSTNHNDINFLTDGSEDGLKNFFVIVSDAGGNDSNCVDTLVSYTLDTLPASFTFASPSNINNANQSSYSISGTCSEIGQEVTVFIGGSAASPQPNCVAGNIWNLTGFDASSLGEGSVSISLDHSDSAGNAAATQNTTVLKDATAPTDAEVQALSWSLVSPVNGSTSLNTTPEISLSGAGSEESGSVQIHIDGSCSASQGATQTITSGQTNHDDITLASDGSQDGAIDFYAIVADTFGNQSNCVNISLGYILDTQPPNVSITSFPAISGSNETTYSVGGTCSDTGEEVVIDIGGITPGANPLCGASNTWTLASINVSSLPDGNVVINANHQDAGGNPAPTATQTVLKDVTAPTISEVQAFTWTLSSPADGTSSQDTSPNISLSGASSEESGSVELFGNATCTITRGSGAQTIVSGATNHNDINLAADGSDDGLISFFARVSDEAGNQSGCADISLSYTLDTTVPLLSLNTADVITVINETTYSISGTCSEVGEGVDILIGTIAPATAPLCDASNNWLLSSINVSSLSDGNVLIRVNHQDSAGNSAVEQTQMINKDTTGPTSVEVNSWTWSLSSPSANSVSSDSSPQVALNGAGSEEGGSVQLYTDASCSSSAGTSQTITGGTTNHTDILFASDGSDDGLKQFFAIASDSLGNPSSCTNISLEYTLDTTAPTQPEVSAFTWSLSSPSNGSNSQDTSPVITLSAANSENGASVQIYDNVTCSNSKGSTQSISGGSSLHNDISYLADGSDDGLISFYTIITDTAGNASGCVDISIGYTLDTSLPTVVITSSLDITTSNESTYSISGTCSEESQDVDISIGGIAPITTPTCGSGTWNIPSIDVSSLGDGTVTITANHSDGLGNDALEDIETVEKDTTAPSMSDILSWTWQQSSPAASSVSSDGTPIVSMSGAVAENGASVQLYLDPVCFETAGGDQTIAAGSTTHNDISFTTDGSADGAIDYYVTVTDSSNNVSDCIDISLGYTLDSVAPTNAEVQALNWSLVTPAQGSTSNETSPNITLSGASSLENGSVQLHSNASCTLSLGASQTILSGATSHNDFSFASDGSEDGVKNFYVVVTDPGSNVSGCVDISLNYTLDTIAPTVAITGANDITNGTQASYSVNGTCNSIGSEVVVSVGGVSPVSNPICNFNAWSISGLDVSSVSEGSVLITANMTDSAGNNAITASVTVNKDTSGPSNPSNFILTEWADPKNSETLTWTASTDDIAIDRYEVRLETSSSTIVNWIDIGNITTYTFVDGVDGASFTLTAGIDYFITVRAFDNDGNVSANITSPIVRFFRPTIPVGLALWFDMSDTSTLYQDVGCTNPVVSTGDPVSCVQSLVGSNRTMTTAIAADAGTYDATLGAIDFNGTSHGNYVMNQLTTNNSVIALATLDSGYASGAGLFNEGTNVDFRNMRIDNTTGCFRANNENNEDANDFTFGITTALRLNAVREECVTEGESFIMVANSDTSLTYNFQLGQQNSARFWKGSVQEVIVYNNTTSTSTAIDIEGYLACKWNLRDRLPTAHLYYNSDPANNNNCP